MSTEWLAIISVVAFLVAAFFAGSETAFLAADRVRLRHLAREGDKRAALLLRYVESPEYFLSIVLVGTNLGVIGCTTTFTAIMIQSFGDSGATIATLILVPTLLIFEEIIPKGVFLYYADRAALLSVYPLRAFAAVLYPIVVSFSGVTTFFMRMLGVGKVDRKMTMSMEELLFHLQGSEQAGLISADTITLASRAFDLGHLTAGDVMIPLEDVVLAEDGQGVNAYHELFRRERFSRIPLYKGARENITGFLSIHNLLKARHGRAGEIEVEAPYIVSLSQPIVEMLIRMKNQGVHMAMVRDKSERIIGMTALEDILERLTGAIVDEFH